MWVWIVISCTFALGTVKHRTVNDGWTSRCWGSRAGMVNVTRLSVMRVGLKAASCTICIYISEFPIYVLSHFNQCSLLPWNNIFSAQMLHLDWLEEKTFAENALKSAWIWYIWLDTMLILCISWWFSSNLSFKFLNCNFCTETEWIYLLLYFFHVTLVCDKADAGIHRKV